jgi:hypothetical protein
MSAAPGIWNEIDDHALRYSRCDENGCDTYDALFSQSGIFLIIDLPGRGMVAKLNTGNGSFVETTTLGEAVLSSFGVCKS